MVRMISYLSMEKEEPNFDFQLRNGLGCSNCLASQLLLHYELDERLPIPSEVEPYDRTDRPTSWDRMAIVGSS